MRMLAITPQNLDLYLAMDHRQMKAIDANYNVKMEYWASGNKVQNYKVYVIMMQMFDSDFVNNLQLVLGDNPHPNELTNHNYKTCLLY